MIEKWRQTFLAMKTQFNTFTPQEWMFYPCSDNMYLYLVRVLFVSHRTCTRVDSPILWCFLSSCDGQLPILRLSQPAKTKAYLYKLCLYKLMTVLYVLNAIYHKIWEDNSQYDCHVMQVPYHTLLELSYLFFFYHLLFKAGMSYEC